MDSIIQIIIENAPFDADIQSAFLKANEKLQRHENIICSVSGGADSDIVIDLLERIGAGANIKYVFFNTGFEYQATKDHIKYLEKKYGIKISEEKAIKPIPICVKEYGVPFLSKQVSEFMQRLQRYGFKWEDKPFNELIKEYPKCKAALRWWCNAFDGKGKFNISRNTWLKEFIIENPPDFRISNKCCEYAKKAVARKAKETGDFDLSITGIRKAEGGARASAYKTCYTESDLTHYVAEYRPIFWFKNETKKAYEQHYHIKHSACYEVWGLPRTGCSGCPFALDFESELEAVKQHEPKMYKAMVNVFGKSYEYTRKYREFQRVKRNEQKNKHIEPIVIDTIERDGKKVNVYLCDRKAKCKNSISCGNECKCTFDINHAVTEIQKTLI